MHAWFDKDDNLCGIIGLDDLDCCKLTHALYQAYLATIIRAWHLELLARFT